MVARARGGFHHGMDPDKPPAAIFNISCYFFFLWIHAMCLFLGAGSAFADPHPPFRRSHPWPPSRSSQRRRRLGLRPRPDNIDVLFNLRYLRLPSPVFRHPHPRPPTQGIGWRYREPAVPRKTLQRMLRASATSETAHGPNRAIRRMRSCRAPLTPSGHDVFAAGCACPGRDLMLEANREQSVGEKAGVG